MNQMQKNRWNHSCWAAPEFVLLILSFFIFFPIDFLSFACSDSIAFLNNSRNTKFISASQASGLLLPSSVFSTSEAPKLSAFSLSCPAVLSICHFLFWILANLPQTFNGFLHLVDLSLGFVKQSNSVGLVFWEIFALMFTLMRFGAKFIFGDFGGRWLFWRHTGKGSYLR